MKKMYVAIEEPRNGLGDTYEQFFKTPRKHPAKLATFGIT